MEQMLRAAKTDAKRNPAYHGKAPGYFCRAIEAPLIQMAGDPTDNFQVNATVFMRNARMVNGELVK